MKRFSQFFMVLLLILTVTGCSGDGSGLNCKEGICIDLKIASPVKSQKPAKFTISVKTDKDISDLIVTIGGGASIKLLDNGQQPVGAELVHQDETNLGWRIDTKAGEEYIFTGNAIFPKPTVSYGIFSFQLDASASKPTLTRVTDYVSVYLDAEGNELDSTKAKIAKQTDYPLPTAPTDQIVITKKPFPTITPAAPPTETPTPTVPAYPGP